MQAEGPQAQCCVLLYFIAQPYAPVVCPAAWRKGRRSEGLSSVRHIGLDHSFIFLLDEINRSRSLSQKQLVQLRLCNN